jgi:hypothetical protein
LRRIRRTLTDLIQLIRFAVHDEIELVPRRDVVMLRLTRLDGDVGYSGPAALVMKAPSG